MARISPYKVASLETFDGSTVGEALEEQYAIAPGEELEAEVHLYEAMPGMRLSDIVRGEEVIARVDARMGTTSSIRSPATPRPCYWTSRNWAGMPKARPATRLPRRSGSVSTTWRFRASAR